MALLTAAATVNIPAIGLSVKPMLNGWLTDSVLDQDHREGARTSVAGEIDEDGLWNLWQALHPLLYCNGTATTMNSLAEALDAASGRGGHPRALPRKGRSAMKPASDQTWFGKT